MGLSSTGLRRWSDESLELENELSDALFAYHRTEWFLEPLGPDVVDLIGGDAAISEKETRHRPSLELVLIRWGSSLATRVETVRVELVEESHDLSDPGLQQLLSRTHTIILLHPRAPRSCERCFQVEGRALRDRTAGSVLAHHRTRVR